MPRDGSGNHSLPAGYEAVTGQTITANQHNQPLEDLSDEITASLPRDGSAAMTGNLPMGANRITGVGDATAATDAVNRQTGDSRYILASGGQVETADIADANVTTAKIADSNVTTAKIADSNVTTAKIADSNVTTAKLADSAVTTAKIADSNVTTAKIADEAITAAKLAAGVAPAWSFIEEVSATGSSGLMTSTADLSAYDVLRITVYGTVSANCFAYMQAATSGPTWLASSGDYGWRVAAERGQVVGGTTSDQNTVSSSTSTVLALTNTDVNYLIEASSSSGVGVIMEIIVHQPISTGRTLVRCEANYDCPSAQVANNFKYIGAINKTAAMTDIRIGLSASANWGADARMMIEGRTFA